MLGSIMSQRDEERRKLMVTNLPKELLAKMLGKMPEIRPFEEKARTQEVAKAFKTTVNSLKVMVLNE